MKSTTNWNNAEILQDARDAAEAAVDQGFYELFKVGDDDEGPYFGDVEMALRGTCFGDENHVAGEPGVVRP